nr:TPA_asm: hypothetical protein HUJ06_026344 [Nelumbo nucifera]
MANATTMVGGKRRKIDDQGGQHNHQPLLPGLPDHLSQLCLSLVPPMFLYSVCRSWRRLIYSPSFPPFLSLYALLSNLDPATSTTSRVNQNHSNSIEFFSFDPISSSWHKFPPPPPDHLLQPVLLRHPSFIARNLPIQSVAVSGYLVLLAATTHHLQPALSSPLVFHPVSKQWLLGPTISAPRRWCATGSAEGAVYIVSGLGSHYNREVARSAERWDLENKNTNCSGWEWEKVSALKHGRFSREAVRAVGWRGKLCMVNVHGDAPKEGTVYNVEKDRWEEMPEGMLVGWNGPAASMDEDVLYVVDETKGMLRRYNSYGDCWEELFQSAHLKGVVQIAAGGGKVCAIRSHGDGIAVVDVVARPPQLWVVDPPPALQAVAVHILPRMTRPVP